MPFAIEESNNPDVWDSKATGKLGKRLTPLYSFGFCISLHFLFFPLGLVRFLGVLRLRPWMWCRWFVQLDALATCPKHWSFCVNCRRSAADLEMWKAEDLESFFLETKLCHFRGEGQNMAKLRKETSCWLLVICSSIPDTGNRIPPSTTVRLRWGNQGFLWFLTKLKSWQEGYGKPWYKASRPVWVVAMVEMPQSSWSKWSTWAAWTLFPTIRPFLSWNAAEMRVHMVWHVLIRFHVGSVLTLSNVA